MKVFLFAASMVLVQSLAAQNVTDSKGLKQGAWSKNYDGTSQARYKGQFKDNVPVGKFTYFERTGEVSAVVENVGAGVSYSKTFYKDGKLASQGKFIDQKKDSVWLFFNESGNLVSRETFSKDVRNGKALFYNSDSVLTLEQNFSAGKLNGKYISFFKNGKVETEENYVNGEKMGLYKAYFSTGTVQSEGSYLKNQRMGIWKEFNSNGSVRYEREFMNDKLVKEKRMNGEFEEFFDNELLKAKYEYKNGKPDGPFVEYREGGTWAFEERTDARTEQKESYRVPKNHTVQRKGRYLAGKLNGKLEYYGPYGNLEKTENYLNGELQK